MVNLELWNKVRKEKKITLANLSETTEISLSTLKEIFERKQPCEIYILC